MPFAEDEDIEEAQGRSADQRRRGFAHQSILDSTEVLRIFEDNGISLSHAPRLWRAVLQHDVRDFNEVTGLPRRAYSVLTSHFRFPSISTVHTETSRDKTTTKLLVRLQDGHEIETVIIRYGAAYIDDAASSAASVSAKNQEQQLTRTKPPRATVCLSSQIGCGMACAFCATGRMGLRGQLTAGEIAEQLYLASLIEPIRNVVFMGMGEPLNNYDEVVAAVNLMIRCDGFNITAHRVCISTVGIVPRLKQLKVDLPLVSLALSLHAPTQKMREEIIPSAKAYNIEAILKAAFDFVEHQKRLGSRIMQHQFLMLEYVMLKGVNSDAATAHKLAELVRSKSEMVYINLIPYNPTDSIDRFHPPTQDQIQAFVGILRQYKLRAIIRQTLGQDIQGACGQLATTKSLTAAGAWRGSFLRIRKLLSSPWVYAGAMSAVMGIMILRKAWK